MSTVLRNDFCELGETPPLGVVPRRMHAWTIRAERHGNPDVALRQELVEVPRFGDDEALIFVKAAGINFNGVWACLGKPVSVFNFHESPVHIPGSDAAGIVWAVGKNVRGFAVGDEVVVHCHQDDGIDDECNGGDPLNSASQRIWGYETPFGSFAQFTVVQGRQLMRKPKHLDWVRASCYVLTLATAYRMLFGHAPHVVRPGSNVLVWGGAGGLGSMAIQLVTLAGGKAVAVVGDDAKKEFVMRLGAAGVINRTEFRCWGRPPAVEDVRYAEYIREVRRFGAAVRQCTGGSDADIVFEHPGADTFPVSCFVAKRAGMVVFCASTTGFDLSFDARFVWTRQKRIQGSHFANQKQANDANRLVAEKLIEPALGEVFAWRDVPMAHMRMLRNEHGPGNHAIAIAAE
jgi:crotonyl-CoA carboxylase/reductase